MFRARGNGDMRMHVRQPTQRLHSGWWLRRDAEAAHGMTGVRRAPGAFKPGTAGRKHKDKFERVVRRTFIVIPNSANTAR